MTHYTESDESRIHLHGRIRQWVASGLLSAAQGQRLEPEVRTGLRRTGVVLRVCLAVFTALVVAASVGFAFAVLDLDSEVAGATATGLASLACLRGADRLASRYRLYRYGVEEALAAASVLLAAFSAALLASATGWSGRSAVLVALGIVTGGSWLIYTRFHFTYAAVAAVVAAAAVPFELGLGRPVERIAGMLVCGAAFAVARAAYRRHGDEPAGNTAAACAGGAVVGAYLLANLHLTATLERGGATRGLPAWFVWGTFAIIWLLPGVVLWTGIRERARVLLRAGAAMALATLVSVKPYLGWTQQSWDPMVLGAVLILVAMGLRRWLASAPGAERGGITATRILGDDLAVLEALGTASVAAHPGIGPSASHAGDPAFCGGRSGGAGAGGQF